MRKMMIVTVTAVLACTAMSAQTTTKKDGKPAKKVTAAQSSSIVPTPHPSEEIKKLQKAFEGHWKVTGKIEDENWAPGGDEGSGTETLRSGPGGYTVIGDAQMKFKKTGPMLGHGVWWWDDSRKAYQGLWCDNGGPTCQMSGDGKWEGEKLVFEGEMPMGPQKMTVRQTYSNFSPKGYDWSMETKDASGKWKPEMTLKYEKAAKDSH